jgi:hypothetical protein
MSDEKEIILDREKDLPFRLNDCEDNTSVYCPSKDLVSPSGSVSLDLSYDHDQFATRLYNNSLFYDDEDEKYYSLESL